MAETIRNPAPRLPVAAIRYYCRTVEPELRRVLKSSSPTIEAAVSRCPYEQDRNMS